MLGFYSRRHPTARLIHLNFNAADPVQLARELVQATSTFSQPRPCLLIDCRAVACLRTRGLGYFVDQLLLIRRTGASIQLLHAEGALRRALHLLHLDTLFELPGEAPAAAA